MNCPSSQLETSYFSRPTKITCHDCGFERVVEARWVYYCKNAVITSIPTGDIIKKAIPNCHWKPSEKERTMGFKFMDKVKVVRGFYKGHEGVCVRRFLLRFYRVEFANGRSKLFRKRKLELVSKANIKKG